MIATTTTAGAVASRVDALEWTDVAAELDEVGIALTGPLLDAEECAQLAALYDDDARFRSTVDMARHRFGEGEYRYFAHPLPALVADLRAALWPHLLPIARAWAARRAGPARGPTSSASGSSTATPPASADPRRCCCATRPAAGTRCTATSTAISSSRSRS